MSRKAVITGIGVIAPNGIGNEAFWQATKEGKSGIRRITRFDPSRYSTTLAGEVDGFVANDYMDNRLIVQTDRWTQMGIAAAQFALNDAAFEPATGQPYEMSVVTASSSGGNEFGQKEIQSLWAKGPNFVGAYQSIAWFYAATSGQISIKYGMKGTSSVIVSEQAGGLDTLGVSRRMLRRNATNFVVAGGTEAPIGPYALTCQIKNGRLSTSTDPNAAFVPFDERADGYVPGEGGAILIVEADDFARERGAPQVYAEVAGYAATQDAYHFADPDPEGRQLARAMTLALTDAGVAPEEIDVVFADAAGVRSMDAIEVKAIKSALGNHAARVPVTAPKTMAGRLYAGGASLDVATAVLAMRDGVVPPTINLQSPAPDCDLDFVRDSSRSMPVNNVLIVARGFGGFNSAVVLRKPAG